MTNQKKYLVLAILSVFLLSVFATADSHAKSKRQSPKTKPPKIVASGTLLEIIHKDPEFDYFRLKTDIPGEPFQSPLFLAEPRHNTKVSRHALIDFFVSY